MGNVLGNRSNAAAQTDTEARDEDNEDDRPRALSTVKVDSGGEEFADGIVGGLWLRVSARSKKWAVVTRVSGKLSHMPLGDDPAVPLAAARDQDTDVFSAESPAVFERIHHRLSVR